MALPDQPPALSREWGGRGQDRNSLPMLKALIGYLPRGTIACPEIPANVRCCPLPGRVRSTHYTQKMGGRITF